MDMHDGNQTATTRYLGMSLRGLTYRLEPQWTKSDDTGKEIQAIT